MKKNFSLFQNVFENIEKISQIDNCVKITLGPTGKNGLLLDKKENVKILTSGAVLIKALEFKNRQADILLKLFEQAASKTYAVASDGSTTTVLMICQLLKNSLSYLINGYNSIFLSNGLKKIGYFFIEKVLEFTKPILNKNELNGVLNTSIGKKLNFELKDLLNKSIAHIQRDGLILVEENISTLNEIEVVEGVELDRGFASSYFVNDLKNFEVIFDNPYILVTTIPINTINQIRSIIEYIKQNNRPLVIVTEEINKDVLSTLVLNSIQKKIKIVVIKYTSIKFMKTGVLEDLALLTHSNYFSSNFKEEIQELTINDLGQAEKVIIRKEKSTFFISKFSKLIARRRINELNRQLIESDTEYEKNIFKTRIARLSGKITKLKVGISNKYQIEEERQKVENSLNGLKAALEEGILPGGGIFYIYLREELKNWSYLNLVGEEIFATHIASNALLRPFEQLIENTDQSKYYIFKNIALSGYPYAYDLINKKIVHTFKEGLLDSSKSIRSILWNSISIVSTLITSQ